MAALALLVVAAVGGVGLGAATAQTRSSAGCEAVNDPFYDDMNVVVGMVEAFFFAGEEITVTGTRPAPGCRPRR